MNRLSLVQELERIPILKLTMIYISSLFFAPIIELSASSFQYLRLFLFGLTFVTLCCYLIKGKISPYGYLIGYYLMVLLFGIWQYWRNDPKYTPSHFSHQEVDNFVVKIDSEPQIKSNIIRFTAEVIGGYRDSRFIPLTGRVRVSCMTPAEKPLAYAQVLWLKGNMIDVPPPRNPLEFDYREYLKKSHTYHQIFVKSDQYKTIVQKRYQGIDLTGLALETRRRFLEKLQPYFKEQEYFSIVAALLYGFRSDISEDSIKAFINTGTIHVLSVSGMHVAVLFGFLSLIFKRIAWPKALAWVPLILLFCSIWGYAFIAGLDPPIVRAAIMISFVICAKYMKRKSSALNALIVAVTIILICSPRAVTDVGLQLSFLAVLGMILCIPVLDKIIRVKQPFMRFLRDTFTISIAAQIFTTPLTLYYFGQFPTYFLLANLFVDLPSTLVMYLGFIMTVNPLEWVNIILGNIVERLIASILYGLKYLDSLAFSTIKIDIITEGSLLLSYFATFSFLYAYRWKDRKYSYLGLFCLTGMLFIDVNQQYTYRHKERFRIYNTRDEFTMGYYRHGRAVIYSTFDSLAHANLQYACGREMRILASPQHIQFISLADNTKKRNFLITLPMGKIAVMENPKGKLAQADILIVRKNAVYELSSFVHEIRPKLVVLDGSNSSRHVLHAKSILDSLAINSYVLKDNFAYVWNKESL